MSYVVFPPCRVLFVKRNRMTAVFIMGDKVYAPFCTFAYTPPEFPFGGILPWRGVGIVGNKWLSLQNEKGNAPARALTNTDTVC